MIRDEKSFASGAIFLLTGGWFVYRSVSTLEIGQALRMGPGYFPMAIGIGMMAVGALILLTMGGTSKIGFREWPWRAIAHICLGVVIFAVGLRTVGFLPSCFVMLLLAARARRETALPLAALIAAGLTLLCAAIFIWALSVPMALFIWP